MSSEESARDPASSGAVGEDSVREGVPFASDWDSLPFERCIKRARGLFGVGKLNQDQYHPTGRYPIIDQGQGLIAGYSDDAAQVYRGPLPVVLFGDHTRELKFVQFPFICGADGVKVLIPDESLVAAEFLYYFLKQARIPSRGYNRHYRLLRELHVPLPCKDEQRRIARVLSIFQRAIEAQDKVIAAARKLERSLMRHLFAYGPVPVTETSRVPLKETEIGPVPGHWNVIRVGDVCTFLQYGTSKRCDADDTGIPVLRIPNVIKGRITPGDLKYIKLDAVDVEALRLKKGDLLFVRTNANRESTGRCAIFNEEVPGALFASYLIRVRVPRGVFVPKFVQLYTTTASCKSQLSGRASSAADGKFNINTQTIKALLVAQPPLGEQYEVVSAAATVENKIDTEEKRKAALQALFKTMLHHLMTGKIRMKDL